MNKWTRVCGLGAILWSFSMPCVAQDSGPRIVEGLVICEGFEVLLGEEVWVRGDTEIRSSGPVRIDGVLRVEPMGDTRVGGGGGQRDGADLILSSKVGIWITGVVQGADGAPGLAGMPNLKNCMEAGGAGGDLELSAPRLRIAGLVVGGRGGVSGPNAKAARGGDVRVFGPCSSSSRANHVDGTGRIRSTGIYGGDAGVHLGTRSLTHDLPAGDGARGGHVLQFARPGFVRKACSGLSAMGVKNLIE